jgi:glucokinase
MLSLGLDLSVQPARAVVVDDRGQVMARGTGTTGSQAAKAAAKGQSPAVAGSAHVDRNDGDKISIPGVKSITRCAAGAAAIAAEAWIGAAKGARHAICLHLGDQVYAGLMLDGRLWTGAHDRAGAAAWLSLNPVERQDYRKLGSLAAEVSTRGIARRLSWRVQAGDESRVLDAAGGSLDAITERHVFDGARGGDGVAISVVRDTAKYIAMAVASLAAMLDPEVVIVSGPVAVADLMLEPVRLECTRRLPPDAMKDLRVEFSVLGADAVAIGAARIALNASA